ncbi:hypothetical protein [Glutamicibacter protophormiae]|uniref:Uncharacterized protein n=1 Tax=Glutamicibacter protophormiae TaxID=37930 RepID=A0ABS4XQ68_GLUPR|nr:hypothetical protein [Glutamicibacter protophormiae]MBP2398658.1 hypothetical protein [Glutamicibacter protophormiae]
MTLRDAWGEPGTIVKVTKNEIRVRWDDGLETPVHPQQLAHILEAEKDGSYSDQEPATANETNTQEKDDSMNNITKYTTAQLVAEADRRGVPVPANLRAENPPAGFKLEYHCACGMGCTPEDLNTEEKCHIIGHSFDGPGVYLDSSSVQLNSNWTAKHGITFHLSNYKSQDRDGNWVESSWTRDELSQLPAMVTKVLSTIDYAAAKEFFEQHPEHFDRVPGVGALAVLADQNNLSAPEAFQAYMDLTKQRSVENA